MQLKQELLHSSILWRERKKMKMWKFTLIVMINLLTGLRTIPQK